MQIDVKQHIKQLELLGYGKTESIFYRLIPGSGFKRGRTAKRTVTRDKIKTLYDWNEEIRGVYFVVNGGGDTDDAVTTCRAFFCEWDDRPLEEQENLWKEKGFLEPTFQVKTRKSIHTYWVLEHSIPSEDWRILQTNLLNFLDGDRTLKNPSRVLRVAGSWHVKAGAEPVRCELINVLGYKYSQEQIEEALQKQASKPKPPSNAITNGHILPIPLERCLPHKQRDLIKDGAKSGGRNVQGFGLAKDLLATEDWLQRNNIRFEGSAEALFLDYCRRCDPTDWTEREWQSVWQSAKGSPPSEPPLPPEAIHNCRRKWNKENKPEVKTSQPLSQPIPETKRRRGGRDDLKLPELVEFVQDEIAPDLEFDDLRSEMLYKGKRLSLGSDCKVWFYRTFGETAPKEDIYDTLVNFAKEKSFNPVKRYLEGVAQSTERVRIDNLAERYFGRSEPIFNRLVELWLISAVARALNQGTDDNPGVQVDHTLILQSSQGKYKSTWFKVLGGAWFSDSVKDIESKDSLMIVHGSWIIELSELDRITSRKQAGAIKHWLTQKTDSFRRPYAREIEPNLPRPCVFCGTVNPSRFLVDDENRRFWIVPVSESISEIDIPMVTRERDGIWAAAYDAYKAGRVWWPNEEEKAAIAVINNDFRDVDAWQEPIEEWIRNKEYVSNYEILTELFQIEPGNIKRAEDMRIGKILNSLGWTKETRKNYIAADGQKVFRKVRLNPNSIEKVGKVCKVGKQEAEQGIQDYIPPSQVCSRYVEPGENTTYLHTSATDPTDLEKQSGQGIYIPTDQYLHFSNSTPKIPSYALPIDDAGLREAVNLVRLDLGWTKEDLQAFTIGEFGVSSWQSLTDGQKHTLIHRLRALIPLVSKNGQPSPN